MTIEASKDQVQEIFFSRRTKFFLSIETDGAVRRLYVFVTRRCGQRCSRSYQRAVGHGILTDVNHTGRHAPGHPCWCVRARARPKRRASASIESPSLGRPLTRAISSTIGISAGSCVTSAASKLSLNFCLTRFSLSLGAVEKFRRAPLDRDRRPIIGR